jgi:Protein-disulfide isomerase
VQPGDEPGVIEVREFFWYGCPHCYRFSPYVREFKSDLPENVRFSHVPAVLAPSWELHGRAFYAARVLGVLEQFHEPMFAAIHEQGRRLDSQSELRSFVSELGIDGEEFVSAMESFAVDAKIRRAKSLQRAYGVSGTPTVVIDGKYVTSGSIAGGLEQMIQVMNERVAAIRGDGA